MVGKINGWVRVFDEIMGPKLWLVLFMNPSIPISEMNLSPTATDVGPETAPRESINTIIGSMAQEGSGLVHETEEGTLWKFHYSTVDVYVQLTGETDEDFLTVWAPVFSLPVRRQAQLLERLLSLNWSETLETCFALLKEQVVVMHQRTVADLSPWEISRSITLVATIAAENQQKLLKEFD